MYMSDTMFHHFFSEKIFIEEKRHDKQKAWLNKKNILMVIIFLRKNK